MNDGGSAKNSVKILALWKEWNAIEDRDALPHTTEAELCADFGRQVNRLVYSLYPVRLIGSAKIGMVKHAVTTILKCHERNRNLPRKSYNTDNNLKTLLARLHGWL